MRQETHTADYWIKHLNLQPHPEGGYYSETYRSEHIQDGRAAGTAIYFLLEAGNHSNLHRLDAEEMWHFHTGSPLTVHMIDETGSYASLSIGADPEAGQAFQAYVPKNVWFGATVDDSEGYALVGCTVTPGFEFSGFELADRDKLSARFPEHAAIIKTLTPDPSQ